jgi:hypothetical protein
MNVIIEPLSEQAWRRVEMRLMDQLDELPPEPRAPRSCTLWPCELVRAFTSRAFPSGWFSDLLASHEHRRPSKDLGPNSSVRRNLRPSSHRPGTAGAMNSYRTF